MAATRCSGQGQPGARHGHAGARAGRAADAGLRDPRRRRGTGRPVAAVDVREGNARRVHVRRRRSLQTDPSRCLRVSEIARASDQLLGGPIRACPRGETEHRAKSDRQSSATNGEENRAARTTSAGRAPRHLRPSPSLPPASTMAKGRNRDEVLGATTMGDAGLEAVTPPGL